MCPTCRGAFESRAEALDCAACGTSYPVVAGIPDLRVAPDPWLDIAGDHAKALRLERLTEGASFEDALRTYWEITPTTPRALAERYIAHVLAAEARSSEWLRRLDGPGSSGRGQSVGPWLDVGCGTADLLAPLLANGVIAVGADIALRWLVVARRRAGLDGALLVCCNAEALPFADATFGTTSGLGLLEHCRDENAVMAESARVLLPGGSLRMRTANRYSALAEPHVGVWGVGLLPRSWADRYVRVRSGQRYLHHRPLSARELRGALRGAGLRDARVHAAPLLGAEVARMPRAAAPLLAIYERVRRMPFLRRVLAMVAPLLEVEATRP